MMKKALPLLMALLLIVMALSACSSNSGNDPGNATNKPAGSGENQASEQPSEEPAEEVTLTYAIWDSNQEKGLRQIADEFEAQNPNMKINIEVTGWSEYWTMLEAGATGGSLPDVFWMHSNEIYRYASNDMLLDLTAKIDGSEKVDLGKFPQGLVQIYNFNGKQFAVPKDFDTIGLWYNKTMFDEAKLSYPDETWTWDDLYNAAKTLTKDGKYGILTPLHNQEGYYNFIYQNGGTVITDDKKSGYDDPKTIEALEYYVKFIQEGLSPKIYGDAERAEAMQNGLAAMGFFGSWNLTGFTENEFMAQNFDVAVLPKGEKQASIFNGLGHAIAHNTKHPEEAWKFVEYLGSKEAQERQAELGVAISAYEGAAELWVSSNPTFNIQAFVDMVDYAVIRPYSNTTAVWEDKAYEALLPAFSGEKTVAEAAKQAAAIMNESLAQEK
ncbi:sugar ABC transporter substrate-binding protein [Paenibacillus nanensis]|uniref:Sugar ABC transporter substrate-binding protein n=1 Tax=Paenibacillus nanensis TaxID=393251 RepID=A0A3A1VH53_9BACL|nr:sugar ABC transporter substrate-binding protein [Paenibacillus nanensis]RIX59644.1 sugar ABC transporter substrate-binding protein [Paenibacillus nanensis]